MSFIKANPNSAKTKTPFKKQAKEAKKFTEKVFKPMNESKQLSELGFKDEEIREAVKSCSGRCAKEHNGPLEPRGSTRANRGCPGPDRGSWP